MELTVDGLQYHVEVDGEGPALLLLHGFTGSVRTWDPWVDRWSARWRLVRVDLPGHGQSAVPADPGRIAMERVCRDLAGILEQLGAERAHVLGYSMGGRTALSFALLHPERVAALVLESASPGLAGEEERRERATRDEVLARRIEVEGVPAFIRWWEEIPLFASQKRLPTEIRERIRAERLSHSPAGLAASLRGMGTGIQPSWWDRLDSLHHPALLLVGEEDRKFFEVARRMKARLPCAHLEIAADVGHAVHVERPDFFGTIVTDFILKNR
ncbi:2-succinyl-6-hydroxy-2,4-cyclohexadiene-1-carboxylate synthase [Desmospora profundinema]|uniref:Putative 2-succinyl-6-hydroxy-2,4-cyclohexadiene-1-carboxylate synthase n=1 Tax=Desmospora profundinema TaxID=1571184 RepID=A0ABU1IRD5_9BACL|nr:2-succinyl-6-hydroxy-2,4-cyclohexadiene-1-carboxylate synthase [Desmospora profundinema]MDR6226719.1 2-succinyl-6-hydroxy-2,4-cyclohexadiene-1-carboxylate synthase [Desmospora profundinema]